MRDKSVLVFYPHNFYEMSAGTHRRIYELLGYFKERGFRTDLLSIDGYTNRWDSADLARRDRFDSVRVCKWKPTLMDKFGWARAWQAGGLPDFAIAPLRQAFAEMSSQRQYGYVVVTYAYWANLVDVFAGDAIKVFNFQDFLTLSYQMAKGKKKGALGRMLDDEVKAVAKFDCALCISEEEALVFKPYCPQTRFVNVPVSFPERFRDLDVCDIDLLFVGSDNPFNKKGIKWFMKDIYPLLPASVRITVVGRVCSHVKKKANVTLIPRIENLDDVYKRTRLAICPLKGGTGLKIKTVEALSFGIPVITTSWGLTGIIQKDDNGCLMADTAEGFAEGVISLLKDEKEYARYSRLAREFFKKHFSTDVCLERLDGFFMREERPCNRNEAGKGD